MEVQKRGFSEIIADNDEVFLQYMLGVISSVDELSHVDIIKTPYHLQFRIAPSSPVYFNNILQEVLRLNNLFNIRVDMGKSMKRNSTIVFNIKINKDGNLRSFKKVSMEQ